MIFRNSRSNLASIFFQIFHFASDWAENCLAGHASAASAVTQAIQLLQQDWDHSQGVQIPSSEGLVAGDALAVPRVVELDLLVPDAVDN